MTQSTWALYLFFCCASSLFGLTAGCLARHVHPRSVAALIHCAGPVQEWAAAQSRADPLQCLPVRTALGGSSDMPLQTVGNAAHPLVPFEVRLVLGLLSDV